MTTKRALVVPTDPAKPLRIIEFTEADLNDQLHREIGVEPGYLGYSPRLETPVGTMRMWVDDEGLMRSNVVHNDRAIAACRGVGYNVDDVAGVAVFTGGDDGGGNTLGLSEALIDEFAHAFGEPEVRINVTVDDQATAKLDTMRAEWVADGGAAAHIVTEDAGMGEPEILIMTREDGDTPGGAIVIERYPLPASHADLDVAVADLFTLTGVWRRDQDAMVAHAGTGYAIVNVERVQS